jgi:NAD(P)-dependent dehydrogenase (short-subunit alcohol dehydrogenase family)
MIARPRATRPPNARVSIRAAGPELRGTTPGILLAFHLPRHKERIGGVRWRYDSRELVEQTVVSGAIVNVGSTLSDRAIPLQGSYCASKHAVKGFTDSLRMELEDEGTPVSVSLVKPSAIDTPYKDHAKNYLPVEPVNPPPVYAPETVAEAILHCAEHPVRDIFVGAGGKAISVVGQYAPRLTDKLMEATMFTMQQTQDPIDERIHTGLNAPSGELRERGGYNGHVAESSAYTKATLHPVLTGAAVLGLGLGRMLVNRSA